MDYSLMKKLSLSSLSCKTCSLMQEKRLRRKDLKSVLAVLPRLASKPSLKPWRKMKGEGIAKMIYRPGNGEILGVHIFGMHAVDLIHEASNAIALGMCIQDITYAVHAHPTFSEVIDEL